LTGKEHVQISITNVFIKPYRIILERGVLGDLDLNPYIPQKSQEGNISKNIQKKVRRERTKLEGEGGD
jgi:hypothetical protein